MCQHDTLWQTSSSRRVNQESQIFGGINLCLSVPDGTRNVPDAGEVLEASILQSLVSHNNNHLLIKPSNFRRLDSSLQEVHLCHQCFCTRVLELECKLVGSVCWIRRRQDSTGPECTPHDGWSIDTVGRVQGDYIAFLPVPYGAEALAKVGSGCFDGGIGVEAASLWIGVED